MEYLVGGYDEVGWVALKALLLYLTAVLGLRVGERRTLAQLSPFDFVAAVAVGAIVGRVPNAHDGSYLNGLATLATVLGAHAGLTRLRLRNGAARLLEHRPRLLVAEGRVLEDELRRCGLTRGRPRRHAAPARHRGASPGPPPDPRAARPGLHHPRGRGRAVIAAPGPGRQPASAGSLRRRRFRLFPQCCVLAPQGAHLLEPAGDVTHDGDHPLHPAILGMDRHDRELERDRATIACAGQARRGCRHGHSGSRRCP